MHQYKPANPTTEPGLLLSVRSPAQCAPGRVGGFGIKLALIDLEC